MDLNMQKIVYSTCETISDNNNLLTTKTIFEHIKSNYQLSARDLDLLETNIASWFNKWRISNMARYDIAENRSFTKNTYGIHQRKTHLKQNEMLEIELNKYKHALYHASKKNKLLEKKLRSTTASLEETRKLMVNSIRSMLQPQASSVEN